MPHTREWATTIGGPTMSLIRNPCRVQAERVPKGFARWRGDDTARRLDTNNRVRLVSGVPRRNAIVYPIWDASVSV